MRNETVLRMLSGFVLVGVFAAGALFGAGLLRWTQQDPQRLPPPPPGMDGPPGGGPGETMKRELRLDDTQAKQLDQILASHDKDLHGIVRDAQSKLRDMLFSIEEELRPHLRPDQVERLEQWRKHRPPPPMMPGMGPPPPGMGPPPPPGMGPPPDPDHVPAPGGAQPPAPDDRRP